MTDTDSPQTPGPIAGRQDPRDREIARLSAELVRTKEKLLVALDAVAGAEAETAEAKGKALEFLREIQARNKDLQEMNAMVPELQFQADAAHKDLHEVRSSRGYRLMLGLLAPYHKVRSHFGG